MAHDPKATQINGKPAEWTDEVRALWARVVAARFEGETRPVVSANYFTPRPYVDEYNRGSDVSGFVYTLGLLTPGADRAVCFYNFPRGTKVAQ